MTTVEVLQCAFVILLVVKALSLRPWRYGWTVRGRRPTAIEVLIFVIGAALVVMITLRLAGVIPSA